MESMSNDKSKTAEYDVEEIAEVDVDPINDIIDYLVRCAKISFKNAHVNESEVRTSEKIKMACEIYKRSPTDFLLQFGKYLAPHHIGYFEKMQSCADDNYRECIRQLKTYHSEKSKYKRVRNRRYIALQKLQSETDYFSEKQMMYRNPLLYEQLVGQYLTDEEIRERDGADNENLTFLSMILETVDRNEMREMKNEQMLEEDMESMKITNTENKSNNSEREKNTKQWGAFDTPDTRPSYMPEPRKQSMITAPERRLLREEFLQEMFSSFIEGRDEDIDYQSIDNNEQYDDLQQVSQDAEDRYFDSETNEIDNLEEHMKLVQEYGRKNSDSNIQDDPLDTFMKHIANKQNVTYIVFDLLSHMLHINQHYY
ncbi:coiled-coil domain-containing protein 97 [Spodoptera litura]|uniref:Coiled-coil domain-containing protein 97 n=1 Tax=Spodoptera litura TaxID=69820 RepID=A0A9J7DSK7_SPOLT|nr:coiled-coil domain-containing protein 97 [Spodoptera litura]